MSEFGHMSGFERVARCATIVANDLGVRIRTHVRVRRRRQDARPSLPATLVSEFGHVWPACPPWAAGEAFANGPRSHDGAHQPKNVFRSDSATVTSDPNPGRRDAAQPCSKLEATDHFAPHQRKRLHAECPNSDTQWETRTSKTHAVTTSIGQHATTNLRQSVRVEECSARACAPRVYSRTPPSSFTPQADGPRPSACDRGKRKCSTALENEKRGVRPCLAQ